MLHACRGSILDPSRRNHNWRKPSHDPPRNVPSARPSKSPFPNIMHFSKCALAVDQLKSGIVCTNRLLLRRRLLDFSHGLTFLAFKKA